MTSILRCPKCKEMSGDAWTSCEGKCPLKMSPDFDADTLAQYGDLELVDYDRAVSEQEDHFYRSGT